MKIQLLVISIIILFPLSTYSEAKGSSHSRHNCYRSEVEAIARANAMKYDRCQYRREGNDLVGKCSNWDETKSWETKEVGYYKEATKPPEFKDIDWGKLK